MPGWMLGRRIVLAVACIAATAGAVNALFGFGSSELSIGLGVAVLISVSFLLLAPNHAGGFELEMGLPDDSLTEQDQRDADYYRTGTDRTVRQRPRVLARKGRLSLQRIALIVGLIAGVITIVNGIITFVEKVS
jgi:hypothetical protein